MTREKLGIRKINLNIKLYDVENFEVGESIELDLDSDQLNLFNEKD